MPAGAAVPNVWAQPAQARRAGRARDRAAGRGQPCRRPASYEVDTSSTRSRRPGPGADRDPGDRPRAEAGKPQTMMILGSDQPLRGQRSCGLEAALGHDHPRAPRPATRRDRADVAAARPQGQDPRPRHGQDQRRLRARRPAPDAQDGQAAVETPGEPSRSTTSSTSTSAASARSSTPSAASTSTSTATTSTTTAGRAATRRSTSTPGYQKLCGARRARLRPLPPRATTTSCARARQQDFLRQAAQQAGVASGCSCNRATELAQDLRPLHRHRQGPAPDARRSSALLKLVLFAGQQAGPARCASGSTGSTTRRYLTRLAGRARQDRRRVPQREGVDEAAPGHARRGRRPQVGLEARKGKRNKRVRRARASRSRAARARTRRSSAHRRRDASRSTSRRCATAARATPAPAARLQHPRTSAARSTGPTGWSSPRASSASTTASRA